MLFLSEWVYNITLDKKKNVTENPVISLGYFDTSGLDYWDYDLIEFPEDLGSINSGFLKSQIQRLLIFDLKID